MQVSDVFKVIYAPHKAFKLIAEKPSYLGPILIAILFIASNVGFAYMGASKTYYEQLLPNGTNQDEWTQNSTLWTSNAIVSTSTDAINASYPSNVRQYYGNMSIAFSLNDTEQVLMQLANIGPINCSSPDGFSEVSFRVKQIAPQENPQNVVVYLFSASPSDYFYYDLTQSFSNSSNNVWNNITLGLVSGWSANNTNPDWSNIRGFRLAFTCSTNSSVSLLVDGLFFRGLFKSTLETEGIYYPLGYSLTAAMQFVITWVILSGLVYLLSRTLGAKLVWRVVLIVIGCVLITMVVQAVINIAAYSTLPNIQVPFEVFNGVSGEGQAALNIISQQTAVVVTISQYTQIAVYVWIIALSALAVHSLGVLTWSKSFLAATVAYFATLFIGSFLFGA